MKNLVDLNTNIALFSVFRNLKFNPVIEKFLFFLEAVNNKKDFSKTINFYTDFVSGLYNSDFKGRWSSFIRDFVLTDENVVSIECARGMGDKIPIYILNAFEFELRLLSEFASITFEDIKELLKANYPDKDINSLPAFDSYKLLFTKEQIQGSYKNSGYGILSKYSAFKFSSKLEIVPVQNPDDISLSDIKLYDYQKKTLKNNTLAFVSGKKANNVLLYGDRGCGKSSSVKAVANEFKHLGLKIIQVYKENLCKIEDLIEKLSRLPLKFILFLDDLVFDENDPAFASCKAVLEGSLLKCPSNILIYATTNRRHLVKENFKSRLGDEIHMNDTMDEAASLSDRFGITITFSSPDKNNYLEIVKILSREFKIELNEELFKKAEAFAISKGTRAPRVARQFLADYIANSN